MRQSWIVGLVAMMGSACGGAKTSADALEAAPPVVAPEAAPVASKVAVGTTLGLAFTANVMGELEPCG